MNYLIYICRRSHVNLRDHKTIINTFIHHQSNQPPSHLITVIYFTQFIYVPDTKAIVNIVIITGIFSLIELMYVFSTPAIPGHHPIPRDRATAPRPTHTAALAIPGERTGVTVKLGEHDFSNIPSRRRQVIITFYVGSTVERSILDIESVS